MSDIQQLNKDIDALKKQITANDGWKNVLMGLGGKMDKTKYNKIGNPIIFSDQELTDMYMDGFAKKVISTPAKDMTRKWITPIGKNPEKVLFGLFNLDAESKIKESIEWMRLYGGSVLLIGAMDGRDFSTPLNINNIKSIDWLYPVERSRIYLQQSDFDDDPMSKNFGRVEIYTMYVTPSYKEIKVHRSRVLEFFGEPAPSDLESRDQNVEYWGMSIIQFIWDQLSALGTSEQGVVNLLYEFVIGKYKLKGLEEKLSSGNENLIIQRAEIIQMFKSILNAVLLDIDEDYIRDSANVGGLADLLDRIMMFLSSVACIPVTRLFGRSPAGMNATGESDLKNYYDDIASQQHSKLRKPIQRLIDLYCLSEGLENHTFDFNSLYEMTEKEKAEIRKINGETDNIYIMNSVISNEEVRKIRFPELDQMGEIETEDE